MVEFDDIRAKLSRYTMTIREVAEIVGVHRNTVTNWIDAGLIPCIRLGGRARLDPEEVRAFLDEIFEDHSDLKLAKVVLCKECMEKIALIKSSNVLSSCFCGNESK